MKQFARESLLPLDQPTARLFVWPVEMMLRFQANMANTIQQSTMGWVQRRQEAARETAEAFARLIHCRDLGNAITIQQEWLEGNIRRFEDDLSALANQTAEISHKTASTARDAVDRSSDAAQAGARNAERTAESMRRGAEEGQETLRSATEEAGKHAKSRDHNTRAA
jgi:methyl-accepting chemotaxis protein